MSTELSTPTSEASIINAALAQGDIGRMTDAEKTQYYLRVCKSMGLNPDTRPLGFLTFQGRVILYATKNCTDQLRQIHGVSMISHEMHVENGVLTTTVTMRTPSGRTDTELGCVVVENLKGEALANARMKSMTKAKRRCTLALVGLSCLDESETDTMPGAMPMPMPSPGDSGMLAEQGTKLIGHASNRDKLLAEFSALFNAAKPILPPGWQDDILQRFGVGRLKEASAQQLANLIDWVAPYSVPPAENN
jgi:hypothetical protein